MLFPNMNTSIYIEGICRNFDPHSPWQQGSNKNSNGLLRQYLPKDSRSDLSGFLEELNVAWKLNTSPRKLLGVQMSAPFLTRSMQLNLLL